MIKNLVNSQQGYTFKIKESFLEISAASSTSDKIVALVKFIFLIPINLFYDAKHLLNKLFGRNLNQVHIMNVDNLHAASSSVKDKILNVLKRSKDFGKKHQTKLIATSLIGLAVLGIYTYPNIQRFFSPQKPQEGYLPHILEAATGLIIGGLIIGGQTLANRRIKPVGAEKKPVDIENGPVKKTATKTTAFTSKSPFVAELSSSTGVNTRHLAVLGLGDSLVDSITDTHDSDSDEVSICEEPTPEEPTSTGSGMFEALAHVYATPKDGSSSNIDGDNAPVQDSDGRMYASLASVYSPSAVGAGQNDEQADFNKLLERYSALNS